MINWKTSIGLTLFMIASVEFLTIKDHYLPARIPSGQLLSMTGFMLTVVIATVLIVVGMKRSYRRG